MATDNQNFVDYVKIMFRSGNGGAGSVHFRREKFEPKGGPDGGNGGVGGSIILEGDKQMWTLLPLRFRRHVFAEDGGNGAKSLRTGADGENIIIKVPLGTIAKDAETGEIDIEITEHEEQQVLLSGGRGGMGNAFFKSATHQTPRYAQPGEPGIEAWKILELKVLADVGLVGFPNAGKSTLLSVVSAAKPKIANYPFTTLRPNLGIVAYRENLSFVMADIPGIIEGAHEGKGLGHRFLRHIERNSILLFMVAGDADDIKKQYEILLAECAAYNPLLLQKERILAISKADLLDEELREWIRPNLPKDVPYIFMSAVTGENVLQLKDMIWESLNKYE
ncbi:MAG: GTPase ObgE [Chitinophagales bacterium]